MNPNFIPEIGQATQFTSENQPANAGRKKNVFNYLKEDYNLSQQDLENIIHHISSLTITEFEDLARRIKERHESVKSMPIIYIKLFEAFGKAKLDDILKLMRATGKAGEKQNLSVDMDNKLEIIITDATKNIHK